MFFKLLFERDFHIIMSNILCFRKWMWCIVRGNTSAPVWLPGQQVLIVALKFQIEKERRVIPSKAYSRRGWNFNAPFWTNLELFFQYRSDEYFKWQLYTAAESLLDIFNYISSPKTLWYDNFTIQLEIIWMHVYISVRWHFNTDQWVNRR